MPTPTLQNNRKLLHGYASARFLALVCTIASLCCFLAAPVGHSLTFCYWCLALFIFDTFLLFKFKIRNGVVVYEFVFAIIFFYVNYVYPVFIYPVTPYFSLFNLPFPEQYINSGIALSTVAFSSFTLGDLRYKVYHQYSSAIKKRSVPCPKSVETIASLLLVALIVKLIPILMSRVYDGNWGEGGFVKTVADIFVYYVIFSQFSKYKTILQLTKRSRTFLLCVLLYLIVFSMIGNRGMLMRVALLVALLYTVYQKKVPAYLAIIVMLGGMFLLYFIGSVRGGGSFGGFEGPTSNPLLTLGKDLTINNRSLYSLMEWRDAKGLNFGKTFLIYILSIIPYGQSILLTITGWSPFDISSAGMITNDFYSTYDQYGDMIGLGTNVVGDIYVSFGVVGVIALMFLLGRIVGYTYYYAQRGNIKCLLLYALLFMDSIIITRSGFLCSSRTIAWTFTLYYLVIHYRKSRVAKTN